MEETKKIEKTEQKSNFVELSSDTKSVGNIFNELSWELGELNFAEKEKQGTVEKKNILLIISAWSGRLFFIAVTLAIITSVDVFTRSLSNNTYLVNLPICPYLSFWLDGYDNTDCKTLSMISADLDAKKAQLEKNIAVNLILLVPKLMQSSDISSSPKVQFIQEHTGDSRISIQDAITHFLEIKNRTDYQGEDIECKTLSADESGMFLTSCQVYGGALIPPAGLKTKTSREIALAFLSRLDDPNSGFQILSYPKILDIAEFSSADGFKAIFSTVTTLNIKLQYLPTNKI